MEEETTQILAFLEVIMDAVIGYGPNILAAVIILVIGWLIAGWAQSLTRRSLTKVPNLDDTLKPIISSTIRYVILIFTMVAVLSRFGVETTSIIAVLGAAGLAIGLALQGTLQNIAAGFMLLMLRPFKVGDFVDASGISGTIKEVHLFTTDMQTADGVFMVVPNSSLWNASITNFSRNPTRRINLTMGISYNDDVAKGRGLLLELMEKDERILADPAPQTMVIELAGSSVNIAMRCWVNTDDYWGVLFDLTENSKEKLESAGMSIPYPQQDVHMHSAEGK